MNEQREPGTGDRSRETAPDAPERAGETPRREDGVDIQHDAFPRWSERRARAAGKLGDPPDAQGLLPDRDRDPTEQGGATESDILVALAEPGSATQAPPGPRPPGPRLPALLQSLAWVTRPAAFMRRSRRRYGRIFAARLGPGSGVVFVSDPDAARAILTGDPNLLRTGDINGLFRPLIGSHSILLLDGEEHMRARRILLPPFHGESVRRHGEMMLEVARRDVDAWPTGRPFRVQPHMHAISHEIVHGAVLGLSASDPSLDRLRELLPRFDELCHRSWAVLLPFLRRELGGITGWGRLIRTRDEIDSLLYAEIRRRREATDLDGRDDVLSLLLRSSRPDGSPIADEEIRDELITLLFAGHETTSGQLTWTVEQLARNPRVVQRLVEEIDRGEETYLDAVVWESMRRRPVLPIVGRKLTAPVRLAGYVLPAGTVLMPSAFLLHHEEDLYPEPDRFRPERFLEAPPGTYTWIPFGGGIRRCIGARFATLEIKVVVRAIVERWSIRAVGRPERVRRRSVSFTPARGGRIRVEPRTTR